MPTRARASRIDGLRSAQLLSPGQAFAVTLRGVALPSVTRFSADGTITVAGGAPTGGDSYTVNAFVADSSPAVLRAAPRGFPAALEPYTALELPGGRVVALPAGGGAAGAAAVRAVAASPYAGVLALARRLAAGAPTGYDVVARVLRYLRGHFVYTTTPPRSAYPLVSFLLRTRVGYCQQFSGAMALLLRMDGIPARVVAGFQTGARDAAGEYQVTAADAHEWVEAYFSGVGWVTFDATPPAAGSAPPPLSAAGDSPTGTTPTAAGTPARSAVVRRRDFGLGASASLRRGSSGAPLADVAAGALALLLAAGGLGWLVLRRRHHRRGDVDELAGALELVGFPLAPSTTLADIERRLSTRYGPDAAGYAALLRARRYGHGAEAPAPSGTERRRLRRVLGAHRGPLLRARLLLALPPGRAGAGAGAAASAERPG